ncbi:MAG: hypothetical protein ACI8O8_000460 [Oleiphilaceae bacterium]|jgi:hypothetical protein
MTVKIQSHQLLHGGNLISASKESGIPLENWIDLSTGISPYNYPSHSLPTEVFSRLPYINDIFIENAKYYYDSKFFVALPGTQAAIQILPKILKKYLYYCNQSAIKNMFKPGKTQVITSIIMILWMKNRPLKKLNASLHISLCSIS